MRAADTNGNPWQGRPSDPGRAGASLGYRDTAVELINSDDPAGAEGTRRAPNYRC
jgi:hypothetical protein